MNAINKFFSACARPLLAVGVVLVAVPASAGAISFEFNADGVLPSAQGAFLASTGPAEAAVYSVGGGLLRQGSFATPNPNDTIGYRGEVAYDPALPAAWEWRVRILDPIDFVADAIALQTSIDAGGRIMNFVMRTTAVAVNGANPEALFFDVGTDFHHYRVELDPGASHFDFFFDGVLLRSGGVSGSSGAHPSALIYWLGGQDSASEWDFVRFANTAAVPAPGPMSLFAAAVLAFALTRRKGASHERGQAAAAVA